MHIVVNIDNTIADLKPIISGGYIPADLPTGVRQSIDKQKAGSRMEQGFQDVRF